MLDIRDTNATPSEVLAYWGVESEDEPIRLARFECCGKYVCRCDQSKGGSADSGQGMRARRSTRALALPQRHHLGRDRVPDGPSPTQTHRAFSK